MSSWEDYDSGPFGRHHSPLDNCATLVNLFQFSGEPIQKLVDMQGFCNCQHEVPDRKPQLVEREGKGVVFSTHNEIVTRIAGQKGSWYR